MRYVRELPSIVNIAGWELWPMESRTVQEYKPIRSTGAAVAVIRLSYVAVVGSLRI